MPLLFALRGEPGRQRGPVVDRVLPAEQIEEAHRLIEMRELLGKVVLDLSAGDEGRLK